LKPAGWSYLSPHTLGDISTVIFLGAGLSTLVGFIWYLFAGARPALWLTPSWKAVALGLGFMLAHEFLHMAALPASTRQHATLGIYAQRAAAFVHFQGQLSRGRSLFLLILPFVALTVAPLLAAPSLGSFVDEWSFVAVWNAFGSSADLMLAAAIVREVPKDAILIWGGAQVCWKSEQEAGASDC
jgi:hypothetical protein